jgi:hypothetical protein
VSWHLQERVQFIKWYKTILSMEQRSKVVMSDIIIC